MEDFYSKEIANKPAAPADYYSKEILGQSGGGVATHEPEDVLAGMGPLQKTEFQTAKAVTDIVPGLSFASNYYRNLVSGLPHAQALEKAHQDVSEFDKIQGTGLSGRVGMGGITMLGRLPAYEAAIGSPASTSAPATGLTKALEPAQAAISKIPIAGRYPLALGAGMGALSGAEEVMKGRPEQAPGAAAMGAATAPVMASAGIAGRFAPQRFGPEVAEAGSRLLTGAGMGAASAAMAPSGQKLEQGILGAGLGTIMPEKPLTAEESAHIQAYKGIPEPVKGYIAWTTQTPRDVVEYSLQRGMSNIDTPENRDPETARKTLIPKLLDSMQTAKTRIGEAVGSFFNQIKGEKITLGPDSLQAAANTLGRQTPEAAALGKAGIGEINLNSEAFMPLDKFMDKTLERMGQISTVADAKKVMDSIADKIENHLGEDISPAEHKLWDLWHQLKDGVGQVAASAKGDQFANDYRAAQSEYRKYISDSKAMKTVLNMKPDSPDYWQKDEIEKVISKLQRITAPGGEMGQRVQSLDPKLNGQLKDFEAAQLWKRGYPSLFKSILARIVTHGLIGSSMGPLGTAGGTIASVASTRPATVRDIIKGIESADPVFRQILGKRPVSSYLPPDKGRLSGPDQLTGPAPRLQLPAPAGGGRLMLPGPTEGPKLLREPAIEMGLSPESRYFEMLDPAQAAVRRTSLENQPVSGNKRVQLTSEQIQKIKNAIVLEAYIRQRRANIRPNE